MAYNHKFYGRRFNLAPVEQHTQMTYASRLSGWIEQICQEEKLPFTRTEVEIAKSGRRADILVYDSENRVVLIIEVKRPEDVDAPYDPKVLEQVAKYVEDYKESLKHIATHNINFLVLYDPITLESPTPPIPITYISELAQFKSKEDEIKASIRKFLKWYTRFIEGGPPRQFDEGIAETLNGYISGIANSTQLVEGLSQEWIKNKEFRKNFTVWLADMGWDEPKDDKQKLTNYCLILAKQYLYIFTNKVLFYNVLKDKIGLPELDLPKGLTTTTFYDMTRTFFEEMAIKRSGDYQTVFKTNFVDRIPATQDAITEITKAVRFLNSLDYSTLVSM